MTYTSATHHQHHFGDLSPDDFERLVYWLVKRSGEFDEVQWYGGARDKGRDVVAYKHPPAGREKWYIQCKKYKSITYATLRDELDKLAQHAQQEPIFAPDTIVFATACPVSPHAKDKAAAHARALNLPEPYYWGRLELDERLKTQPQTEREFFHQPSLWQRLASWWTSFRQRPLIFYSVLVIVTLIVVGVSLNTLYSFRPVIPFTDEVLIVIATFHHPEGIADTEAHNEIRQAIQQAAQELGFSHLRVKVEPTRLTADDRARAERLGKRYNASMVIWGADTGVRVTVNFLNLKQPDFDAAEVQISETERTQIANPSAYANFIIKDLPGQLTFLSLFAIGQSYYVEEAYADSIRVVEKAIASLALETGPLEGLADAYFRLGWLYQGPMNDDEQAIVNYDQAIKLNPGNVAAYINRGLARYYQGDLEGAIADFDQAIVLDPDYAIAYTNRGLARAAQGDLEGAIADFDQAIALDPDLALAYNNRGNARYYQGDLEGAIADFDQAIAIAPDFAAAYNNRGSARKAQGDLEGAIADFDQAIALAPGYAEAYLGRGLARYDQGDLEGAIADYDQAIALDPDDALAYANRGAARYYQGDLEEAIADYDQAIALDPDYAIAYIGRGLVRYYQGDLEGAITDFDQAIAIAPGYAEAYLGRGLARKAQGDLEGAIADFDQAITLDPDLAAAYANRGNARSDQGDLEGAIADYDQAIALDLDPDLALAYLDRGLTRAAQGDLEGAIADFNQAIALDPDFAFAYFSRGLARYYQGDLEGAIADFNQAIALDPDFAFAYFSRGLARAAQGDLEGAIADYDQAIALDPDDAAAYTNRGSAYAALQDYAQALQDLTHAAELMPYPLAYFNIARVYSLQSQPAEACPWLEKTIALDPQYRDHARIDPNFDPIRTAPCFQTLVNDQ